MEEAWELAVVSIDMKVFCSWSGDYSREAAEQFASWLPYVLQNIEVFVSTHSIAPGDRWSLVLADALDQYDFGFLFVTSENLEAPWLLFEAGALAKSVERGRVIPVLLNVDGGDMIGSPLSQFQYISPTQDAILSAIKVLWSKSNNSLAPEQLPVVFEKWWGDLEHSLLQLSKKYSVKEGKKKTQDRFDDLENTLAATIKELRLATASARKPNSSREFDFIRNSINHSSPSERDELILRLLKYSKNSPPNNYSYKSWADIAHGVENSIDKSGLSGSGGSKDSKDE